MSHDCAHVTNSHACWANHSAQLLYSASHSISPHPTLVLVYTFYLCLLMQNFDRMGDPILSSRARGFAVNSLVGDQTSQPSPGLAYNEQPTGNACFLAQCLLAYHHDMDSCVICTPKFNAVLAKVLKLDK